MSGLAISDDHVIARAGEEQLVTMRVDHQLFGLPILTAQDIVETHTITQVPMAPSAVAGVMNLRGRIVTVINLRRILGQEENIASRMGVTVEHDGELYTILVDEIGEVMSVVSDELEPVPTTLDSGLKSLCAGIYRLETGLLALLDIDQILNSETILQTPQIDFAARKRLLEQLKAEAANELKRAEAEVKTTDKVEAQPR
jgi:purine-binding chemotaxis protein CheW